MVCGCAATKRCSTSAAAVARFCSPRPSCFRAAAPSAWTSGGPTKPITRNRNTLRNAEVEGVADRVEVRTADITDLPFDNDSVDVIVSSLVVHNIPGAANRAKAISEAARVLRPGGRLVLADIWATRRHVRQLRELGWTDARRRGLGWRMWWGPGMGTHLVTATKPG
jgi:SAM-dependent methyltransferase